jgi:peptidoglycan/xylan/chitin deacetylase (PgdA/CDA1 family)
MNTMASFVLSIDDAGLGGNVESLTRTCRFLESRGIRATWFVVPRPAGEPLSKAWLHALLDARDAGHDLQLHGLTHSDCYEFGPPAWPATAILPSLATEYESRRDELIERYTVEKLRGRIEEGIEIFDKELGVRTNVFRAPCGAVSKAMYEALRQVGIRYHTCAYISATGYEFLAHRSRDFTPVWTDEIPHRPFRWYSGIVEIPILNEYTWSGAVHREADLMALMRQDVDRILGESPVVTILMHTHGIAYDYEYAFRFVDLLAERLASDAHRFATIRELVEDGELDRSVVDAGPDVLTV